jgi:hypothetical protein
MLIDRLPVRRAKNRVREKIVELGLVEDVKELRKKRPGKSARSKESNRDESDSEDGRAEPREGPAGLVDSESDESEESDEGESDNEPVSKTKELKTRHRPKQYGFALKKSDYFSPEMLAAPLRQLVSDGEFLFSVFSPFGRRHLAPILYRRRHLTGFDNSTQAVKKA